MGSTSISWVLLRLVLRHPLEKGYGNLDTWLKVQFVGSLVRGILVSGLING